LRHRLDARHATCHARVVRVVGRPALMRHPLDKGHSFRFVTNPPPSLVSFVAPQCQLIASVSSEKPDSSPHSQHRTARRATLYPRLPLRVVDGLRRRLLFRLLAVTLLLVRLQQTLRARFVQRHRFVRLRRRTIWIRIRIRQCWDLGGAIGRRLLERRSQFRTRSHRRSRSYIADVSSANLLVQPDRTISHRVIS
jgi:hypothetical protein